jgi:hypothetical protein
METRDAAMDGGIIQNVVPFFRSEHQRAVVGVWSGGRWSPTAKEVVHQYRGKTLVGIWQLKGVDYPARQPARAVLILERQGEALEPLAHDILVFGEGVYSQLSVADSDLTLESDAAVEFGNGRYHGVAQVHDGRIESVLLFHQIDAAIDRHEIHPLWWRGKQFSVQLKLAGIKNTPLYVIQLTLDSNKVSLQRLLKTLPPLRAFVLDAGQEMLFQEPRPLHGRRLAQTYDYFEPLITAAPGSLQLLIRPCEPNQLPLYAQSEQPLRLWIDVLAAASHGSVQEITRTLFERVFSVDDLLKRVRQFVKVGAQYGDLRVTASGLRDEIVIERRVVEVIQTSINTLETRRIQRTGTLYALELVRRWFRVLVEGELVEGGLVEEGLADKASGEMAEEPEDWTIRFDDQWEEAVSGNVPRQVTVEFTTQTRPGMKRGTGTLISIRDEGEQLTGSIHNPSAHAKRR